MKLQINMRNNFEDDRALEEAAQRGADFSGDVGNSP